MRRTLLIVQLTLLYAVYFVLPTLLNADTTSTTPKQFAQASGAPDYALSQLWFVENVGQLPPQVRFQTQVPGGTLFLTPDVLWLSLAEPHPRSSAHLTDDAPEVRRGVNLRLTFPGANPNLTIEASHRLPVHLSSFKGNQPGRWQTDIPVWGEIRYHDLYPGIDLIFITIDGRLSYQLEITDARIADLRQVQLQVDGADRLWLEEDVLRAETSVGIIPLSLIQTPTFLSTPPTLRANILHTPFRSAIFPSTSSSDDLGTLSLPSNLLASTFVGGNNSDIGADIAIDLQGNAYILGETFSLDFPTTPGAWDTTPNTDPPFWDGDLFVVKVSPDASQLLYATYLGGRGSEYASAIAVDATGAAYLTGYHYSPDFPTTAGTGGIFGGGPDTFVVKLNPQGNQLEYVVFLGGTGGDRAKDIALDATGAAYVAGYTDSLDFTITPNGWDTVLDSDSEICGDDPCYDGFVSKITPSGLSLSYSTFLGGSNRENLYGIAVDNSGAAYVTGRAYSPDYPTTNGVFQPANAGGMDVIVTKVHPSGSTLVYSTFVGGNRAEHGARIALDTGGSAYITGETLSPNLPVTDNAFDTTCGINGTCDAYKTDAFLLKLNPTASELQFSTFLGSAGDDSGVDIATDTNSNIYVLAGIAGDSVPSLTTPGALYRVIVGTSILKFNADGSTLLHGTTGGGERGALFTGIQIDNADSVYVSGFTTSPDYPTTANAFDPTCGTDGYCNYRELPDFPYYRYYDDTVMTRLVLPSPAVTITLAAEAGELISPHDGTQYQFAANTFTDTMVITHAPRHPLSMPPIAPAVMVGHAFANYALSVDGTSSLTPTLPYTLTVTYSESEIATAIESSLALYSWDGAQWVREPTSQLDPNGNTVTATPARFGWWQLLGDTHRLYLPVLRR